MSKKLFYIATVIINLVLISPAKAHEYNHERNEDRHERQFEEQRHNEHRHGHAHHHQTEFRDNIRYSHDEHGYYRHEHYVYNNDLHLLNHLIFSVISRE